MVCGSKTNVFLRASSHATKLKKISFIVLRATGGNCMEKSSRRNALAKGLPR
jgi:hypothetical protein